MNSTPCLGTEVSQSSSYIIFKKHPSLVACYYNEYSNLLKLISLLKWTVKDLQSSKTKKKNDQVFLLVTWSEFERMKNQQVQGTTRHGQWLTGNTESEWGLHTSTHTLSQPNVLPAQLVWLYTAQFASNLTFSLSFTTQRKSREKTLRIKTILNLSLQHNPL